MGLISAGSTISDPGGIGLTPGASGNVNATPVIRVQAAAMVGGSSVGLLGAALPHPPDFHVAALVALNVTAIIISLFVWVTADRLPAWFAHAGPPLGTLAVSAGVLFSRDATSAYALIYLFPALYAYYFLRPRDGLLNILFAVVNYAAVIFLIGGSGAFSGAAGGSVVHHLVVTVGMMLVVGLMLLYLRGRVAKLISDMVETARTDLDTGLLNMNGLTEQLAAEFERAQMSGVRLSMLSMKVKGLGKVRRARGHQVADTVIGEIAELLTDSTRRIDSIARTGVAEFTIVLPDTDSSTAFLLGEQILGRIRRSLRDNGSVPLSLCVGIATFPRHAATSEALLHAAETAAIGAESMGSDCVVVFNEELGGVLGGSGPAGGAITGGSDQRTHITTVLSLAEVLNLRDSRTATHSLAVARYCELLGRELGLPEPRIARLRIAGLVHDIGKVGISESILDQAGPLSPEQWEELRRHPELAARILAARELADIREWVLKRHEQPDGHGYPRGLTDQDIPLESKILAVAESYDAMTSPRPYREAMGMSEAIDELGRYAGSQFDGRVVDAMVRILADFPDPDGGIELEDLTAG